MSLEGLRKGSCGGVMGARVGVVDEEQMRERHTGARSCRVLQVVVREVQYFL